MTARLPASRDRAGRDGPPPFGLLPDFGEAEVEVEPAVLGADVLDDWTPRFVAQFAAPGAQHLTLSRGDGIDHVDHVVIDVEARTWACLTQDADGLWTVRQGGRERLWDDITERLNAWRAAGEPAAGRLRLHVGPEGQALSWD